MQYKSLNSSSRHLRNYCTWDLNTMALSIEKNIARTDLLLLDQAHAEKEKFIKKSNELVRSHMIALGQTLVSQIVSEVSKGLSTMPLKKQIKQHEVCYSFARSVAFDISGVDFAAANAMCDEIEQTYSSAFRVCAVRIVRFLLADELKSANVYIAHINGCQRMDTVLRRPGLLDCLLGDQSNKALRKKGVVNVIMDVTVCKYDPECPPSDLYRYAFL